MRRVDGLHNMWAGDDNSLLTGRSAYAVATMYFNNSYSLLNVFAQSELYDMDPKSGMQQ